MLFKSRKVSLNILRALEKNGEMSLSDISKLILRRSGDHRDFYPLAAVITEGWVEDDICAEDDINRNPDYELLKTRTLAWKLFATSDAGKKADSKCRTHMIYGGGDFRDQVYALTGKGYLYLNNLREKQEGKVFTLLMAIFSALLASFFTIYITK